MYFNIFISWNLGVRVLVFEYFNAFYGCGTAVCTNYVEWPIYTNIFGSKTHPVFFCFFLSSHRVIILEDDLEKLMVVKETEEMTCAGYQELKEHLQLLEPHMKASTCCWDDTLTQVDRMLRRVSSCPGQGSSSQPITAHCFGIWMNDCFVTHFVSFMC